MINRAILTGRLTKDPELRQSQSGVSVATFNLAVNRAFADKNGERGADFINCVAFKKQAENVSQYLNKGSLVGVDGRIQTRSYENKEGRTVYVTEIVCDSVQFLEPKNQQEQAQQNYQQQNYQQQNTQQSYQQPQRSQTQQYQQGQIGQPENRASQGNIQNNAYTQNPADISDSDLPF